MRNVFLALALLGSILTNAQNVPLSVNYQSVVRSQSGTILPNQQVSLRFSIIRDSILGNIMYQEQHTVVSNDFGLVNLKLGEGVPLLSQFRLIDWSLESILIKIELSIGGSPFTTIGEEGFSSVPYSIYSNRSSYTDSLSRDAINTLPKLTLSGDTLYFGSNDTVPLQLTTYTLTEAEVDAYVSNNGYLTSEIDGSVTNEIQDLQLNNHSLTVTNNTTATTIDLTPYLDNTNLSESQVDGYVANNGYLTSEIDGSVTNEIQDLQDVLNQGNDASNQELINVKRQSIGAATIDTSAALDISSTIQGFLPPRMTQIQRDAIFNPAVGLLVWCSDCGVKGLFSVFTGSSWSELQLMSPEGSIPTVSTFPITSFGFNSATVSGAVTFNGGKSVLAKGLCYSKTPYPNISDFITATDTGVGSMSYTLNNLDSNSRYFVRAYAQNQNGIAYGSQQEFTTKRTIAVGDTFGGGIVAYILEAGDIGYVQGEQHGIIVSEIHPINQRVEYGSCGSGLSYPEYQSNIMVLDSTKTQRRLLSAIHNMNLINNSCSNISSVTYYVNNWMYNGYSDWVVPSLDDLYAIKSNQSIINNSLDINHQLKTGGVQYWSSTTYGQFGVFQVSFGPNYFGDIFNSTASSAYFVPVRYF